MQDGGRDVLRRAVREQRRHVGAAAVLFCGHQAGEAMVPVIIGLVIDEAVADGGTGRLVGWLFVLALVFAELSFAYRFGARAGERASQRAAHDLRVRLAARVLDHSGGAETGRLPGTLAGIATSDADRVGVVNFALPGGLAAIVGLVVGGVALLRVSVPLGLLVLLGTPPLLWLVNLLGRPLEDRSESQQERAAHAFGVAADLVTGLRVLKGIGAEAAAAQRYRLASRDALDATLRAARARASYEGAMLAMNGCFLAVVALVGGRLAADGRLTIGQLVTAVGLALFLIGPLEMMAWVGGELSEGRASAGRVAAVLAAPPAVAAGGRALPDVVRGEIALLDVRHDSLAGLDLRARAGECLGVAADASDAGAVLRCLSRATDPASGTVELDGVPLAEFDLAGLRHAIVVAAHDADLFEGTVLDNVLGGATSSVPAGHAGRPEKRVAAALAASGADEVAAALHGGTESLVGERGRSLSGGQRQRVALARALAAEPAVLVLHDPTTAVDAATEARIADGIRRMRAGRTTILVTSSPALLAVTDRVALLEQGRVTADGTHADLVARVAAYRARVLS